jgi:hypothetical protein
MAAGVAHSTFVHWRKKESSFYELVLRDEQALADRERTMATELGVEAVEYVIGRGQA